MSSSGVEFDEDALKFAPRRSVGGVPAMGGGYAPSAASDQPRMVQWLMKKGIVKSPAAAQVILIGLVIVNIIITYIVITHFL